jgi:hypothetical protein
VTGDEIKSTLVSEVQAMRRHLMEVDELIDSRMTALAVDRARMAAETLADSARRLLDEARRSE